MNNSIIGSVNQSFKKLNDNIVTLIQKDQENIDLESYFKDLAAEKYSVDNQHAFIKSETTEFPESLAREVEQLDYEYKMGFLPAINQMWLSTGRVLFLWNYKDKSDIFRYECSDPIHNVEIIKFSTHNELVVSTTSQLFLHGLGKSDKGKLEIISSVDIRSDGVIMSNFATTNTRRVFMQGSDGHLYELNIISDNNGLSTSCKINCHTANPLLKYLPNFFKSVPEVPLKSMVVDDNEKLLYLLLKDSSIHSVNIQGSHYLPIQRNDKVKNLESIHLIPSTDSKHINLMAVSNKGDRLYFACKDKSIDLIHTRPAPPLPGSLLFNGLTNERSELSFYNHGVFVAVLSKSERKYLVMTSANSVREFDAAPVLVEDVYYEPVSKRIWSITESSSPELLSHHYFKETLESPENPVRQFSTLSETGITHYTKQRPIDYLEQVLSSNNQKEILTFVTHYGAVETCALAFLLVCSSKQSPQVVNFLRTAVCKEEGLLLHFSRVVENIWNADIMLENIPQDEFKSVQNRLIRLLKLLHQADIKVKDSLIDLITRTIEGISFICFVHNQGWDQIKTSLSPISTSCSFAQLVSTEEGALLARELILAAIKFSTLSNSTNNYNFISGFLHNNCSAFLGESNITYYKAMECLQGAHAGSDNKHALALSLGHFENIIQLIDLADLETLCHEYCKLGEHLGAIKLGYAKHQTGSTSSSQIYNLIFASIEDALKQGEAYSKSVIEQGLGLTNEESYHNKIYSWLIENDQKNLLVKLDTPLLTKYIKTQLSPSESLASLCNYHLERHEYASAIGCLEELATEVEDIRLELRINCLQKACNYLPQATGGISEEEKEILEKTRKEAEIQLDLYRTLIKSDVVDAKLSAAELGFALKPAKDLFHNFAYTHALYEEALRLMDVMEFYDWGYAETAWAHIINKCKNESELKSKMIEMAERLYPSIASFPVYTIFKVLEKHCHKHKYSNDFTKKTLVQAGVPEEVVDDAKATLHHS